jgi:hypothetical protein
VSACSSSELSSAAALRPVAGPQDHAQRAFQIQAACSIGRISCCLQYKGSTLASLLSADSVLLSVEYCSIRKILTNDSNMRRAREA